VDLAPTILNMLDLPIPDYMQGTPFLGGNIPQGTEPVYLFSDRVGEVLDMARGLRDNKFRYIRNYFPFKERMQFEEYSEITPIRMELRKLDAQNKLQGPTKWRMEKRKPAEDLYDVDNDPVEMNNLASDPQFSKVLIRMREQLTRTMIEIGDLSFVPEAEMKRRAGSKPPYTMHREHQVYKLRKILKLANKVGKAESGEF